MKQSQSQAQGAATFDEMLSGGEVTATCRGTFVSVPPGHPGYHRWGA